MTRLYRINENELVCQDVEDIKTVKAEKNTWITCDSISPDDLHSMSENFMVPEHLLSSALDKEESARIDQEKGAVLVVIDVPMQGEENGETYYYTEPFVIVYNDSYLITIGKRQLVDDVLSKIRNVEPQKKVRMTLLLIYQMCKQFINFLNRIDRNTQDIEKRLHSSMKNKELFELMSVNKSLVYFSNSLHANRNVLNKLLKSPNYQKFDDDKDLMDDAAVELDQALEMCTINSGLLTGMMDAFASIINNNVNVVMKALSVITIVISIPTLVSSFYGMNLINIPLEDNPNGFYIVMAISIAISLLGGGLLLYFTRGKKGR